jgi:hypothetical protein
MHQAAPTPTKTQVEIPYGIVEYTAIFKKPIIEAWTVPGHMVATTLQALEPYGFKLDGVEVKTHTEKLSEYGLVFRRNPSGLTFTVGIGKLVIVAENLDSAEVKECLTAAHTGINAIIQTSKAEISAQHTTLAIHIQSKTKPRHEITAALLTAGALGLLDGDIKFPGIILHREKSSIFIDGSLSYANGIFARITREHAAGMSLDEIAKIVRSDEEQLFETLGLEGDL